MQIQLHKHFILLESDDRKSNFVNNIWSRQLHDLMESDLYNLLPNPDNNDVYQPTFWLLQYI